MQEILQTTLGWYGHQVTSREDSQKALEELSLRKFDLLICDFMVQPNGGFELCRQIRRSPNPDVMSLKILMLTTGPLDFDHHQFSRHYDVYVTTKFKSPEQWLEKINLITHARSI